MKNFVLRQVSFFGVRFAATTTTMATTVTLTHCDDTKDCTSHHRASLLSQTQFIACSPQSPALPLLTKSGPALPALLKMAAWASSVSAAQSGSSKEAAKRSIARLSSTPTPNRGQAKKFSTPQAAASMGPQGLDEMAEEAACAMESDQQGSASESLGMGNVGSGLLRGVCHLYGKSREPEGMLPKRMLKQSHDLVLIAESAYQAYVAEVNRQGRRTHTLGTPHLSVAPAVLDWLLTEISKDSYAFDPRLAAAYRAWVNKLKNTQFKKLEDHILHFRVRLLRHQLQDWTPTAMVTFLRRGSKLISEPPVQGVIPQAQEVVDINNIILDVIDAVSDLTETRSGPAPARTNERTLQDHLQKILRMNL